jgi:hypothetical protein
MLARCLTPSDKYYPRYGGRGITVCPEWREFLNFYHDMGPRPSKGHSIDRIDNNGPYEPGNCRWATWTEQERNRRNNRLLTINGETLPVSAWAEKTGVPAGKIYLRLRYGIPPEKAIQAQSLRTPARSTNRLLTINGETHPVSEWAKLVGIPAPTIYTRLYHGRTPSEAIQTAHFRRSDAASRT